MVRWKCAAALALAAVVLCGCTRDETPAPAAPPVSARPAFPGPGITVPPEVAATWGAVVLQAKDRTTGKTERLTVPIGGNVPFGTLDIAVTHFLPDFVMDLEAGAYTSRTNEPSNPAVKATVRENGAVVFDKWIFGEDVDAHPFPHERYGIFFQEAVKK